MRGTALLFTLALLCGCAGIMDGLTPKADRPEAYEQSYREIHAMQIGETPEREFVVHWYGTSAEDAKRVGRAVALREVIGPISSPNIYESDGYRSATYYIGRVGDYQIDQFLWAVTFVNGTLQSIFSY